MCCLKDSTFQNLFYPPQRCFAGQNIQVPQTWVFKPTILARNCFLCSGLVTSVIVCGTAKRQLTSVERSVGLCLAVISHCLAEGFVTPPKTGLGKEIRRQEMRRVRRQAENTSHVKTCRGTSIKR
ncbi:hypothetical protein DdX_17465 [Ditylenchus destructor]|uniref:Uncharacterized protein n=1 Tax=Ditylenchus destructor TaxID=166010 RepID=A0AAD4MP15_9BILA|nr:hypothetical protein DdX_17465 [Ditylenchus destructor]